MRLIDPAAFERTIEINLLGVWRTVRACLPSLIERRGYVLVIASLAAAVHGPGMAAYSASKAGAEAFADSLRSEFGTTGWTWAWATSPSSTPTWCAAATPIPPSAACARSCPAWPARPTRCPPWARRSPRASPSAGAGWWCPAGQGRILVLRTALAPLLERQGRAEVAEADALFERDVAERGAEAASRPVGPGRRGRQTAHRRARLDLTPPGGIVTTTAKRDPRMIPLGYGKFVRADRVYALVPLERTDRADGRRTYVHVDGLTEPIVASRSERAILADVETALAEAAGIPRRRRAVAGQESLL